MLDSWNIYLIILLRLKKLRNFEYYIETKFFIIIVVIIIVVIIIVVAIIQQSHFCFE